MTVDFTATPPSRTRSWVERLTGRRIVEIDHLAGATTAAVHRINLDSGVSLVVKRFVWNEFVAEEPERARHEGEALLRVAGHDIPAPELIAYDEHGDHADVPAVLTTHLPGGPALDVAPEVLAAVAARINAVDPAGVEWRYFPYFTGEELYPPAWSANPTAWECLFETALSISREGRQFVHRDFHPWNVLADQGEVTGVVDWLSASRGPWEIDVAHCRGNLVKLNRRADADRYRAEYELLTRRTYSPAWDAMACVDGLPFYDGADAVHAWRGHDVIDPHLTGADQPSLLDAFAIEVAAQLG